MSAGYSGTPLARKLGIKSGMIVAILDDPGDLTRLAAPLPPDVTIRRSARGKAAIAVVFSKRRAALEQRLGSLERMIYPDGAIWVCWPKKASGVATDISEDMVREVVLPRGLVDIKVAAIDQTWSGLKVVWRKELR